MDLKIAQAQISWGAAIAWGRKHSPNLVTGFRILLVPVFVLILIDPTPASNLWATGIFFIASVSDWLDGYLARLFHAESILGKLLDPLADKVLVTAALVMLCGESNDPRVPAWMVVVLLSRDMLITGLRSVAAVQGVIVPASYWAKHKTAFTMIGIGALLIGEPYRIFGMLIDFRFTGMTCLWMALLLSISTGIAYFYQLRRLFNE